MNENTYYWVKMIEDDELSIAKHIKDGYWHVIGDSKEWHTSFFEIFEKVELIK